MRVRAPATTANVGPGFDCVAAALDLWNEVEVGEGRPAEPDHLGVRAFALLEPPAGYSFSWTARIPRERGLGSSASVIALGLVAASRVRGEEPDAERLLALGLPLEGHPDNLAAALAGGVVLTWEGRIARVAEMLPLEPVAVVPGGRTRTDESRATLPEQVPRADAVFTAARAALLGAGVATLDPVLFAAALADRLHEPYRPSPILDAIRAEPPAGAEGATLSGSGPSVVVWASDAAACAAELERRFPDEQVLRLRISAAGACAG
jgi:homoserine kinase